MHQSIASHVKDLAQRCYSQNIYTFTSFLTLAEQADIYAIEKELQHVPWDFFGGTDGCERRMMRFGNEEFLGYEEDFPINCIVVSPLAKKFSDELSHRDFLGALMNLGINRDVIGDIVVKENCGYIFCEDSMSEYIKDNLVKVKHTSVKCDISRQCPENAKPNMVDEEIIISSNRIDAIIAKIYNLSRGQSLELFRNRVVFIDGRQCENNSAAIKDGAAVSVRGYGKFVYNGTVNETRKGRYRVLIKRYCNLNPK